MSDQQLWYRRHHPAPARLRLAGDPRPPSSLLLPRDDELAFVRWRPVSELPLVRRFDVQNRLLLKRFRVETVFVDATETEPVSCCVMLKLCSEMTTHCDKGLAGEAKDGAI